MMKATRLFTLLALLLMAGGVKAQNTFWDGTVAEAKDVLNIRTGLQNAWVEVYDMNGKLIHSQALTENVTRIDATDWAEGVYVWKVISNGKLAETGKWIKKLDIY